MKKAIFLPLFLCVVTPLFGGCSSKPDVSDVSADIKEFWKPCKLVKPTNFKKDNGVDRGSSYQMAISYTLEITKDIAEDDIWDTKIPKEISPNVANHDEFLKKRDELNAPRRAALQKIDDFYSENCPMPALVYFQFYARENEKYGASLSKGESLNVAVELTMIKSENGWIVQ
jgi:hypothetical protein